MNISKRLQVLLCLASAWLLAIPSPMLAQESESSTNPPLVLAHYMPWYTAKPYSDHWGWHWTMNHFDPEKQIDGKRQIASKFYPLIGPYDSGDPDVLEYHLLLMKMAGIDGVIVDWYGLTDFRIPVFLCRQDKENRKIYRKHEIRMAAYCHLIATAEQAKAPFGLILFAGTYDAVTVPITDKHVAQLRQEVAKAREIIRQQEQNRQQPQRPLNESICAGCHHGEPQKYKPGVTEVKLGEVVLAPFLTEDVAGQRHVSNCGTRYRWVPRHKKAVQLRMTD